MRATDSQTTTVTVLGLGNLGAALASAVFSGGYRTTVWNRTAGKVEPLVAAGASGAGSLAEALDASDVVVVCLATYDTVYAALSGSERQLAGKSLVNLTSGTPEEARQMARWAQERGIHYLDGAVMAVPPMIGQPHALIFYGGNEHLFEALQPLLKALGGRATYLGEDTAVPMLFDVALLGILWSTLAAYLQALALVGTEDVAAADFLPHATAWVENVALPSLDGAAREVDAGEYATQVSTLGVNQAAIDHLVATCRARGITPALTLPIKELIDRRVAEGHGSDSLASLIEAMR